MPVCLAERDALGDQRLVVGASQPLQFEVVAIAEQLLPVARQGQRIGVAARQKRAAHVAFGRTRQAR